MVRTVASLRKQTHGVALKKGRAPMTNKNLNKKIKRIARAQLERKYAEAVIGQTSQSSTVTVTKITMPSQGDAFNNREGDEITFSSIKGRWQTIGADSTQVCRYIVLKWLPDDAVEAPIAATVLQSPVSVPWISQFVGNKSARAKFRVLYDSIANLSLNGDNQVIRNINIGGKKLGKVKFNAAATTGKGCIYVVTVSDSSAITHPTIGYEFLYRWTD